MTDERLAIRDRARERERKHRWTSKGRARVAHPKYGAVVVPHNSNFAAIQNAAEYWGCDWLEVLDAEVWAAKPGDGPVVVPKEFLDKRRN